MIHIEKASMNTMLLNRGSKSSSPTVTRGGRPNLENMTKKSVVPAPEPLKDFQANKIPPSLLIHDKMDAPSSMSELFEPLSDSSDFFEDFLNSEDITPLLRLSPPPLLDYNFNLEADEGACELFDLCTV